MNVAATNGKLVYNSDFNFYIEDEHGKHVIVDGKNSYTFEILRTINDLKVENIIFSEKTDGEFETSLIKYDFTKYEYQNRDVNLIASRNKEVSKLVISNNVASFSKSCVEIVTNPRFFKIDPINCHIEFTDCGGSSGSGGTINIDLDGLSGGWGGNGQNTGGGYNPSNGSGNTGNTNQGGGGGGIGTTPVVNPKDPCQKMKNKLDSNEANLKPKIQQLQALITPTGHGEFGMNLVNSAGIPLTGPILSGSANSVMLPFDPSKYGEIHTHPFDCYPMYSFTDIARVIDILTTTLPANVNEVTTMLTMPDDAGVMQTYAVTINDVPSFIDTVNNTINNVDLPPFFTTSARIDRLNEKLAYIYRNEANYERGFLQFFTDFNLNLYKADANLTKWNRLLLNEPSDFPNTNSSTTVISSSCN